MNDSKKMKISGLLLESDQTRNFLLAHLNRIYSAKTLLFETLPQLSDQANFKNLKQAIVESWTDISRQMARIEAIYMLLDATPSPENNDALISYAESSFKAVNEKQAEPGAVDLSILFYLSVMESLEMTSFQLLISAATDLPDPKIKQLLRESFDQCKANGMLFLQATAVNMT